MAEYPDEWYETPAPETQEAASPVLVAVTMLLVGVIAGMFLAASLMTN